MEYILLTLLLSAFFSGIEIAYISVSKLRIELKKNKGTLSGKILSEFVSQPSRFISTLLVGNNIALVAFGSLMATVIDPEKFSFLPEQEPVLLLIQTVITTGVILIFGEFLPKILFRLNPIGILSVFSLPLKYLVYIPLKPVTFVFDILSKYLIRLILQSEYQEKKHVFSAVDLEHYVKQANIEYDEDNDDEDELNTEILEKALDLRDVKLRECLVPRTEIEGIDINSSIEELREKFISSKLSRIILFEGNIDKVVGYTHHFELLKKPTTIEEIKLNIPVVPETMTARDCLPIFTKDLTNIALVVDEYGGTAGVITLEDLIEEIFGEIQDEHDLDDHVEKVIDENTFLFSARLEVDYLNDKYDLEIPEGDYETLSGFIVMSMENIPDEGETFEIGNFNIKIEKAEDNVLKLIRFKKGDL